MENKEYIKTILSSTDERKHEEMVEYIECLLEKIDKDYIEEMER